MFKSLSFLFLQVDEYVQSRVKIGLIIDVHTHVTVVVKLQLCRSGGFAAKYVRHEI